MDINPPFQETYKNLFKDSPVNSKDNKLFLVEGCKLPLIDLNRLTFGDVERHKCIKEMAEAACQWGFFQVINHGVSRGVLESMQHEQMKVFHEPFNKKVEDNFLNLSANSYRWGNPKATCLSQFSWSEAFHIPLTDISRMSQHSSLRYLYFSLIYIYGSLLPANRLL